MTRKLNLFSVLLIRYNRKLNKTGGSHTSPMVANEPLINTMSPKIDERILLLCDQCLWASTCIDKKYLVELSEISETEYSCPICKQDQLSSFPVIANEIKGIELTFE